MNVVKTLIYVATMFSLVREHIGLVDFFVVVFFLQEKVLKFVNACDFF